MMIPDRLRSALGAVVEVNLPMVQHGLLGKTPACVAAPRSEEAARELVAWCGREKVALVPRGGGNHWQQGARPTQFEIVLCTRHLTEIFDFDEGNGTLEAGAGLSLGELNEVTGKAGQYLPLDLPPSSTLGGIVAGNVSGAWRHKYGTPRDMVTGLRVSLSDGRHLVTGAKVVKNVSGFDLPKLFTGSRGALGLIERVTIRLRPQDASTAVWSGAYPDWAAAEAAALGLLEGPFVPTLLRLVLEGGRIQVRARFDGGTESVASQVKSLPASLPAAPSVAADGTEPGAVWQIKARLPRARCLDWVKLALDQGALTMMWDIGVGAVRATYSAHWSPEALGALRVVATKAGGSVSVEVAPGALATPEIVWGQPGSDFALLKKLKGICDEAAVFSPGRSIGGI